MSTMTQQRECGYCGRQFTIDFIGANVKSPCGHVVFNEDDKDEGQSKHFIPSHFFDLGQYEVWACKSYEGGAKKVLIADKLTLKTAKTFCWPLQEIRLNGKVVQ